MRSTFDAEARGMVIGGVRAGLTLGQAAVHAGLAPSTVANWASRGRSEIGTPHARFAEAVDAAREAAQAEELTEREFHSRLDHAVRSGSVTALRLWWTVHERDDEPPPPDAVDALAAQRLARRTAFVDGNGSGDGTEAA